MRRKIKEEPLETKAPIRQARFYVADGDFNPSGYSCNGIEIMRQRGETNEELRARCRNTVNWPDSQTQHTFIPL